MSQSSGKAEAHAQTRPDAAAAEVSREQQPTPALQPVQPRADEPRASAGFARDDDSEAGVLHRVAKLERRIRVQFYALAIVVFGSLAFFFKDLLVEDVIVRQTIMESKELKLLDNDGNARLFLRMYSKVPVLQIMDGNGKPRMSLGLRFDDTPFLDLSDRSGRTRATFEMSQEDSPAIRLFDENGNPTFNIN